MVLRLTAAPDRPRPNFLRYPRRMPGPIQFLRGVRHPEAFHGTGVTKRYFEGWYVKLVSADLSTRYAVIPGIFLGPEQGTHEAFVQVLDGLQGRSWYHRYPVEDFEASDREFLVHVGPNRFSLEGVTLDLPGLSGSVSFTQHQGGWPVTLREPGIMGWYGMVPFMECFHGIVSFGHGLTGVLAIDGDDVDFSGGRGYIEKDWGQAFPEGYVWLHSNHIQGHPEASFIGSVAIIPWLRRPFRGFIAGLWHSGRLHKWTTYNKTTETRLEIDDSHVRWALAGPDGTLEVEAARVRGGILHAPLRDAMHKRVDETLDATIRITHRGRGGEVLIDSTALASGLEVYGDIDRLVSL